MCITLTWCTSVPLDFECFIDVFRILRAICIGEHYFYYLYATVLSVAPYLCPTGLCDENKMYWNANSHISTGASEGPECDPGCCWLFRAWKRGILRVGIDPLTERMKQKEDETQTGTFFHVSLSILFFLLDVYLYWHAHYEYTRTDFWEGTFKTNNTYIFV